MPPNEKSVRDFRTLFLYITEKGKFAREIKRGEGGAFSRWGERGLFGGVCAEFAVEGGEFAVQPLGLARLFQNGEDQELEFVLKFRLFHDDAEKGSNCFRGQFVRSASKSC